MKNDKTKNQRQKIVKKIEIPKSSNMLSPITNKRNKISKSPKEAEYFSKDLLENTRKYLEMSKGNNNFLMSPIPTKHDYSEKFASPTLTEDYSSIAQKYTDTYDFNNFNLQDELDNDGNDKLHRVKDEYIEYLQRQLDENNQNVMRLESKLNELQKRFKNLIDDNRILNDTLNERNNKLNEFMQENENLRLQISNYADNESKYRLQIQYCEKQIGLYETNINDYNNIIKDLKSSNEKLASNLTQKLDNNKNNKQNGPNNNNNNFSTNNSNNYNNYNYFNVKNVRSDNDVELQFLKNQNMIYSNNIKSKDSTIDFIQKKNEKLVSENKILRSQMEQYIQQINNLYTILKKKNKIISIFKQKGGVIDKSIEKELDKLEEQYMKFMNNTFNKSKELLLNYSTEDMLKAPNNYKNINQNSQVDRLMTEIEDNKKRINIMNTKGKPTNNQLEYMKSNKNNIIKVVKNNKKAPNKPEINNITTTNKETQNWRQRRIITTPVHKSKKDEEKEKEKEKDNIKKEESKKIIFKSDEKNNDTKNKEENVKAVEEDKNKTTQNKLVKKPKHIKFKGILEESPEKGKQKEEIKDFGKKKNKSGAKKKKKFKISDLLDVTEINTSSPVVAQNLSFSMDESEFVNSLISHTNSNSIYLFGIDRNDIFHIFDLVNKKFSQKKILEIEDISDTFKKDYQYDGTILYNTLDGVFILTGKKLDMLYYYNPKYDTINKICQYNNGHDNGSLLLDKEYNRLFVFGGKETTKCEYYSFNDKKVYDVPDLIIDRANGSFIICNNKIYGFFGFSYKNNKYCGNIESIDNKKLDRWSEVKNINILNEKLNFEVESVSTINYKEDKDKILIYAGIQGDNEDYVTDYYYLYDTKENSIDLVEKWESRIMRYTGSRWRNSNFSKKEPVGFHFAKNSTFLKLPKDINIEGYENDLYLLMDYKNNVHFINQDKKSIDIYKGDA